MTVKNELKTRRQFLKTTAAATGSVIVLGMGCSTDDDDDPAQAGGEAHLFAPGKIGSLELKNRIVRSATGECLALNGLTTEKYLDVYSALASGGVGLIISGMTAAVQTDSVPLQLYAFDDQYLDEMRKVKTRVLDATPDCKLVAQIAHSGNLYFGETRT